MPLQRTRAICILLLVTALGASCGRSEQARSVGSSGFLEDYSQLEPDPDTPAQRSYINPNADFAGYQKLIVDPVVVWEGERSKFSGVTPEDLEALTRYFSAALREQLGLEFQLVEQPGPGTLRLRIAIVGAKRSGASADPHQVEAVSIEVEVLDASSGERLVAAADSRVDEAAPAGSSPKGSDVRSALDYWAEVARERLTALRRYDAARATVHEPQAE